MADNIEGTVTVGAVRSRSAPPVPQGWEAGMIDTRLAGARSLKPGSYDAKARTVEAVIATDYRVRRWYGFEELAMRADAIDLTRLEQGQVRLLDTHDQWGTDKVLGNVLSARIEGRKLVGVIKFSESEAGREAERAVAAGEVTGISAGYRQNKIVLAETSDGDEPDVYRVDKWELLEASLVSVPADPYSQVRSLGGQTMPPLEKAAPKTSILARMRMRARQIGLGF